MDCECLSFVSHFRLCMTFKSYRYTHVLPFVDVYTHVILQFHQRSMRVGY